MTATPPVVNLEARSLVKKLCRIMAAVDHVEKRGRNLSQGYDFARESDITHALREQFAKENVFMLPDVVEATYATGQTAKGNAKRLCTLKVKFTFEDGDTGETRSFHGMGEAEDTGDKASNKAITAAVKYGLLKSFLIPTGDDPENDSKPERPAPPKPPAPRPPPPKVDARGETPAKPNEREVAQSSGMPTKNWSELGEPLTDRARLEVKMNECQSGEELTLVASGIAPIAESGKLTPAETKELRSIYAQRMNALLIQAKR